MKKIALIIIVFIVAGYIHSTKAQNTEITVYVTDHDCCPSSGYIDGDRENQGDGIGELYTGEGTYTVYWNQPLTYMEMTTVVGETGNTDCIIYQGKPEVQIYCYGKQTHLAGNPYPSSLDFYLYLGVIEYGSGGPPPGGD